MIHVKVTGQVKEHLRDFGDEIDKVMVKALLDASFALQAEIGEAIVSTSKYGRGGLADSYKVRLLSKGGPVKSAGVFSNSVYARIQDQGGVVRPRRVKWLTIPMGPRRGPPKGSAKGTQGISPRTWKHGYKDLQGYKLGANFFWKSKTTQKVEFMGVKRSTIRARYYLDKALKKAQPVINKLIANAVRKAMQDTVSK